MNCIETIDPEAGKSSLSSGSGKWHQIWKECQQELARKAALRDQRNEAEAGRRVLNTVLQKRPMKHFPGNFLIQFPKLKRRETTSLYIPSLDTSNFTP